MEITILNDNTYLKRTHKSDNSDLGMKWMKAIKVEQVIASHCTGFAAQTTIYRTYRFLPVKSGNIIEINQA